MIKNTATLKDKLKITRSEYDAKIKNKLVDVRKGKPCIRFHSMGYCFEQCGNKATHREINAAEEAELFKILCEAGVKQQE